MGTGRRWWWLVFIGVLLAAAADASDYDEQCCDAPKVLSGTMARPNR